MTPAGSSRKILVVTDGKRGHLNQSLAVSRRLGDPVVVELRPGLLKAVFVNLLSVICAAVGQRGCQWMASALGLPVKKIRSIGCDAIVSAGQSVVGCAILFKGMLRVPLVVLMKPTAIPLSLIDVVLVPIHDLTNRDAFRRNLVAVPVALSEPLAGVRQTPDETAPRKQPVVAFLVGGQTRGITPDPAVIKDTLTTLIEWASQNAGRVLLTTSRRTPLNLSRALKSISREGNHYVEAIFADETDTNPVADFLRRAEHIIVTEDSFSMVSEAVLSGKKPFILETGIRRKFWKSYARLAKMDLAEIGDIHRLRDYLSSIPKPQNAQNIIDSAIREVKLRIGWKE